MFCLNCNTQLPDGTAVCHHCRQSPAAPPQHGNPQYQTHQVPYPPPYPQHAPYPVQYPPAPVVQPYIAPPKKSKMHADINGTGYIIFITLLAWSIAVAGPVYSLVQLITRMRALGPQLLAIAFSGISGNIFDSFLSGGNIFSGFSEIWTMLTAILNAVIGGIFTFIGGITLPFVVLIPLIIMLVVLRRSITAARVLLIINACLCITGNLMCYSFIKSITDVLTTVQASFQNIALHALIGAAAGAFLWIIGIVFYFVLASKSVKLVEMELAGAPMAGGIPVPVAAPFHSSQQAYHPQPVYSPQPVYHQPEYHPQPVYSPQPGYQTQPEPQPILEPQPEPGIHSAVEFQPGVVCTSCGEPVPGKFCRVCGTPAPVLESKEPGICKNCGTNTGTGRFCPSCGSGI